MVVRTNSGFTFEALSRLDPEERQPVKGLIESVLVKHDVRRSGLANAG
jgi:hypothetical protein